MAYEYLMLYVHVHVFRYTVHTANHLLHIPTKNIVAAVGTHAYAR